MAIVTRVEAAARCRNCDRPATKLGRLVRVARSGRVLYLTVCRFCYAQLRREQKARVRR